MLLIFNFSFDIVYIMISLIVNVRLKLTMHLKICIFRLHYKCMLIDNIIYMLILLYYIKINVIDYSKV